VNTFYLFYGMQSVRGVQDCTAVLYEPAIYIKTYLHEYNLYILLQKCNDEQSLRIYDMRWKNYGKMFYNIQMY